MLGRVAAVLVLVLDTKAGLDDEIGRQPGPMGCWSLGDPIQRQVDYEADSSADAKTLSGFLTHRRNFDSDGDEMRWPS